MVSSRMIRALAPRHERTRGTEGPCCASPARAKKSTTEAVGIPADGHPLREKIDWFAQVPHFAMATAGTLGCRSWGGSEPSAAAAASVAPRC